MNDWPNKSFELTAVLLRFLAATQSWRYVSRRRWQVSGSVFIILIHQIVFQGMFFAKNISLRRKLSMPVRGRNREVNLSIGFFGLFIVVSVLLGLFNAPFGTVNLVTRTAALAVALALLAMNLLVGSASLIGLRDSWRVGEGIGDAGSF